MRLLALRTLFPSILFLQPKLTKTHNFIVSGHHFLFNYMKMHCYEIIFSNTNEWRISVLSSGSSTSEIRKDAMSVVQMVGHLKVHCFAWLEGSKMQMSLRATRRT